MRVLLLGEYSGLYSYLKDGLRALNHEVVLISDGDGFKEIQSMDSRLSKYFCKSRHLNYICNILYRFFDKKYYYYDVVQCINPGIFQLHGHIYLKHLKKKSGLLFFSAAGDDYSLICAWKNKKYRYSHLDECHELTNMYPGNVHMKIISKLSINSEMKMLALSDGIIPTLYEYAEAYRNNPKRKKTIPFPINVDKIEFHENTVKDKIIFFHGLNREEAKGTKYIREAMNIIQDKYPNDVECIIDGKMPLDDYIKLLSRTNVVIDQCLSYGYGMNACIAMAQGKVVMSGFEPETLKELGIETCPGINILPNVNDIVFKMEWIIQHKDEISRIGFESRQHIEKYHHYIKIAQLYIDTWIKGNT